MALRTTLSKFLLAFCVVGAAATAAVVSSSPSFASSRAPLGVTRAGDSGFVAAARAAAAVAQKPPTKINQTVPLAKAPAKGKTFIYLQNITPADTTTAAAVKRAVLAAGWKYDVLTWDPANLATLQAAYTQALQKGANYVGTDGAAETWISPSVIKAYRKAKAHIIMAGYGPIENTDVVNTDPSSAISRKVAGKLLADWFIADSGGKGSALVSSFASYPILVAMVDGFKAEVAAKCPGCKVKVHKFTPADLAKQLATLTSDLRANSSLKYLLFDYAGFGAGVDSALKAAKLGYVKIGGVGTLPTTADALRSGAETAWVAYSWAYSGYALADVAFRLDQNMTAGLKEIRTMPVQLLTKKSIGNQKGDWEQPVNTLQQFQKLWHVGASK
jgi:ribose transport system substrate-binding protein